MGLQLRLPSLRVLQVQGNPAYEPDPLIVKVGDTIAVENKDTTPHTVTNGKDATDPNMGMEFDTSIINAGGSADIVTADLKPGDYPYFCAVHPYMKGTLQIYKENEGEQRLVEERITDQKPLDTSKTQIGITERADHDLIKALLHDAIENLRNGNNERALVYMDFVRAQLLLQDTNSSMPKSTGVLISDAIESLQEGDSNTTSLYLNQANDQLAILTGSETSFSDDVSTTSENVTIANDLTEANKTVSLKDIPSGITNSTYDITIGNMTFPIKYQVNGATINNITADRNQPTILIGLSSINNGTLTLEIPRSLLDSKGQGSLDEEFIVFADGHDIGSEEINSNNQSRILTIYFEKGVQQIKILGTNMIHLALPNSGLESMTTSQILNMLNTNQTGRNGPRMQVSTIEDDTTSNITQYSTYEDEDFGFTIQYPSSWNLSQDSTLNKVVDFSPEEGVDISVRVVPRTDNETLKDRGDVLRNNSDFKIREYYRNDTTKLAGLPAILVSGSYFNTVSAFEQALGYQSSISRTYQIWALDEDRDEFYAIVMHTNRSNYDEYLPIVKKMIDSFQLTETAPIIQEED